MNQDELINVLQKIGIDQIEVRGHNIMGCCPYHQESRPSWGIHVEEPHLFGCFACGAKGTLKNLLIDIGKYSHSQAIAVVGDDRPKRILKLRKSRPVERKDTSLEDILCLYANLPSRIAKEVGAWRDLEPAILRAADCRYHHHDHALLFPWRFEDELVAITGRPLDRSITAKSIAYGKSYKSESLYLPTGVISKGPLVIVEGEFDALKVVDAGVANVGALGFGNISDSVIDQILQSDCDNVIAFLDYDDTGHRLEKGLRGKLRGRIRVTSARYRSLATWHPHMSYKLDPGMLSRQEIRIALSDGFQL